MNILGLQLTAKEKPVERYQHSTGASKDSKTLQTSTYIIPQFAKKSIHFLKNRNNVSIFENMSAFTNEVSPAIVSEASFFFSYIFSGGNILPLILHPFYGDVVRSECTTTYLLAVNTSNFDGKLVG